MVKWEKAERKTRLGLWATGEECGSDHNHVIVRMKTRLQRAAKPKRTVKWNVSGFKKPEFMEAYSRLLDKRLQKAQCD